MELKVQANRTDVGLLIGSLSPGNTWVMGFPNTGANPIRETGFARSPTLAPQVQHANQRKQSPRGTMINIDLPGKPFLKQC